YPDFLDFQARVKSFDGLAAMTPREDDVSDTFDSPQRYFGLEITVNGFSVVGQKPILGRDFMPQDARSGAPPVVILSYRLWDNRYAKKPSIIGTPIRVNGLAATVIGVMPPRMHFPGNTDVWRPFIPAGDWQKRDNRHLTVFGHLEAHATIASARDELSSIARRLAADYVATNKNTAVQVQDFNAYFIPRNNRQLLLAMVGAVGCVLLIACANVANLLLSRAVQRPREISIRVSLGAARWRVIQQLLVEGGVVSAIGGLLGWLIA